MKIFITTSSNNHITTNSKGSKIHATNQGNINFWKWFGDSTAVDKQGRPIVFYHGTANDHHAFGSFVNWFSPDHETAAQYASLRDLHRGYGANVMPVYLNMRSTFDANVLTRGDNSVAYFVTKMAEQSKSYSNRKILALLDSLRQCCKPNAKFRVHDFWFETDKNFGKDGTSIILSLFKEFGFDSIYYVEDNEETYGVFEPNQIKSAIGNNGNFCDTNNSIIASVQETVKVDGVLRSTTNSNGDIIHSTKEGIINFWKWFGDSVVVDVQGRPRVVYHGTNTKFSVINVRKGAQNLFWFSSDRNSIINGESGASGTKFIMELYIKIEHPAHWKEYDQLGTGQYASRGLDGAILFDSNVHFDGFVMDGTKVKSTKNKGQFYGKSIYN